MKIARLEQFAKRRDLWKQAAKRTYRMAMQLFNLWQDEIQNRNEAVNALKALRDTAKKKPYSVEESAKAQFRAETIINKYK